MISEEVLTVALRLAIMRLDDEFSHIKSTEDLIRNSDKYIEEAKLTIASVSRESTYPKTLDKWGICEDCHGYGVCQEWCMP